MKNRQQLTAVQAMNQAFAAQGVTVPKVTFFGRPIQDYFGEPVVSENPVTPPARQAADRSIANQMQAAFAALGVEQLNATVFGVPVAEFFGRPELGVWEKILREVSAETAVPSVG
ncbi:MAG: hypothetical protein IPM53_21455 [Anaerolineaceae bacterium]|nr:hypothetical protein [Anaerolineaceae bacterium]